ncbi:hypothetical protein [Pandoraea anhela]|uniref:Uncharacterized protein n=1 Tax=Pandoraea anhela TaxID=2508295 RepID=A0A5E4RAT1_9BURK|nr:hypothetical protein [Pandoraea anhela]VVD59149.1 hypothetical protein PAN31108_00013 [Pandoraea anhela]
MKSTRLTQGQSTGTHLDAGQTHSNTPHQASTSASTTSHPVSPEFEGLKRIAKKVYKEERKFHGTDSKGKASIRSDGFQMSKKDNTNAWATDKRHYLAPQKMTAMLYAKQEDPAIVRTLGAHTNKNRASSFEASTNEPGAYVEWIRTSKDIKAKHVLGSKRSAAGPDAEVFRERMERAGHKIDTATAGRLLRDVQSDSEHDFSDRE